MITPTRNDCRTDCEYIVDDCLALNTWPLYVAPPAPQPPTRPFQPYNLR